MCGIAGFFDPKVDTLKNGKEILDKMTDTLIHRGPDDNGIWIDKDMGMGLGHRRLAILDLSPGGHQPMYSASGRYVIIFNGEIYNFMTLRKELEQESFYAWRGNSDTEVMLAAIEKWGIEEAVKRFVGMFAFALYDRKERVLYLVRDRIGIKPLYYGWIKGVFVFASELKAIKSHPYFSGKINLGALALLLRHNYIPTPYSIYEGIYKLYPGHILTLRCKKEKYLKPVISPYWSAKEVVETGNKNPFSNGEKEAIDALESLLKDAIKLRMIADVPLGAFLSGGVDSSTVVALMQAQSTRPVKTFTIGFYEQDYDEARYAKEIATHLGTEHTELYVTPKEAMEVVPKLPTLYDEPFSDSSQIPTFLISKLARTQVTVSLSGDGGDELFGGYNRYFWGRDIWDKLKGMPYGMRMALAKSLTILSPQVWDAIFFRLDPILPRRLRQRNPGDKLHKLAGILGAKTPKEMYYNLVSHWRKPTNVVIGAEEPLTVLTNPEKQAHLSDFVSQMMYLDLVSYLPDDILVKVDRASMGVSLEARVPILDHRIVEFAWRLPLHMKIRGDQSKWILRQVLYRYVPRKLIERPKMGFGIPIDKWLRGPLRDWAESLLDESRLRQEGFFNPLPILEKWREHLSGRRNWQHHLWDVLMFQAWLEKEKVRR